MIDSHYSIMSRIHPSASEARRLVLLPGAASSSAASPAAAAVHHYTVWQRSSMGFQGTDGFSVYDAGGALAFRVDNYSRRRKLFAGDLLLMDGHGAPLLALSPQIISVHDQWNCYKAAEDHQGQGGKRAGRSQHLFSMRKCSVLYSAATGGGGREAQVFMSSSSSSPADHPGGFWVEGCFRRRSCKVRRNGGDEEVARITRKKAGAPPTASAATAAMTLGDDVFSLEVQPGVEAAMIMAFVVVLDRICWRPYTPLLCST